jgi:hypothetical protein
MKPDPKRNSAAAKGCVAMAGSALLEWIKTKDDPEIYTAEVSPSYRYFLLGTCGKYIACYSSGTTHKVIGYVHTAGTKMETMEDAKERCERHRQNAKRLASADEKL